MSTCPYCATSISDVTLTCPNCGSRIGGWALPNGTNIAGKYRLESVLGQGGFGITYGAYDSSLDRSVAIKELFPDGSTRQNEALIPPAKLGVQGFADTKRNFLEEARTLARFNHPSIVRVFEVFETNGTAYIVMEALEGESLSAVIFRTGKLSEVSVKKIATDLCDALEVIHQTGLLHRDIKPDNVYITKDNRAVLIDFGSARGFIQGQAKRHTQLVTPGYAAPEQYATEAKFGAYTDVYGLSATLYHAVTGNPPPTASDRVISSDTGLRLPESVTELLKTALTRGLALRIDARPQNAQEFVSLLEKAENVIPVKQLASKPSSAHEEVLYRGENILITTKQIEITQPSKYASLVTIKIQDLESFDVVNDPRKIPFISLLNGSSEISTALFLLVPIIGFVIFTASLALLRNLVPAVILALPLWLMVSFAYISALLSDQRTFYLIARAKTQVGYDSLLISGRTTILLVRTNLTEIQPLFEHLKACLEP
jgi:serine/threonine protein kinase